MPVIIKQETDWIQSYHLEPDKGKGWFALYRIDDRELHNDFVKRIMTFLRLVEVAQEWDYACRWYAKKTPVLFLINLYFNFKGRYYWWLIKDVLYKRLHLIRRPPEGCIFIWKECFKPILLLRRIYEYFNRYCRTKDYD